MARRTGNKTPQQIAKINRRAKVRQDMLNGLTNQSALAVRHGVSQFTAHLDVHAILAEMNEEQKELGKQEQIITLHRLEDNIREASNAWERSKENKEEVRIEYQKRKCKDCNGTGMENDNDDTNDSWCTTCNGNGYYTEELVTRKQVGQAGDPRFLAERRECFKMKCYLLGLKPENKGGRPPFKGHVHDTTINVQYIDTEAVIRALQGLNTLKAAVIESKLIEEKKEEK